MIINVIWSGSYEHYGSNIGQERYAEICAWYEDTKRKVTPISDHSVVLHKVTLMGTQRRIMEEVNGARRIKSERKMKMLELLRAS